MSTPLVQNWGTYTTDSVINAVSITAGSNSTSNTITISGTTGILVSAEIAYGATASACTIYILGTSDDTNYQSISAGTPFSFLASTGASTTVTTLFSVDVGDYDMVKIAIANPSGNSSVTATLRWKSREGAIG